MGQFIYRGESPGKEAARSIGYAKLDRWKMYDLTHIVVAGDCGDVNYLLRHGVPAKNILACDINYACVRKAEKTGVRATHGDIVDVVREAVGDKHTLIGSVNVDLCRSLIHGLPVLKEVIETIRQKFIYTYKPCYCPQVFFTFLCGHDPGLRKDKWEDNPGAERKRYFREKMGKDLQDYYTYQSWTQTSYGSPMCMAYL